MGGFVINILPRSMLNMFRKSFEYLILHNIMVVDFSGKSSNSDGMIAFKMVIGSCRRPTIFVVVPTQASFNLLLGRGWIHGVCVVPSIVNQKLFFWNKDG